MAETDKPFSLRWTGGKRIDIVDRDGNVKGTFTFSELIGFLGIWGSTDRGETWVPIWVDKDTGSVHVHAVPTTATVVYTRNADNFITSEVWSLETCTVTITYTRNADNFITQKKVVVS